MLFSSSQFFLVLGSTLLFLSFVVVTLVTLNSMLCLNFSFWKLKSVSWLSIIEAVNISDAIFLFIFPSISTTHFCLLHFYIIKINAWLFVLQHNKIFLTLSLGWLKEFKIKQSTCNIKTLSILCSAELNSPLGLPFPFLWGQGHNPSSIQRRMLFLYHVLVFLLHSMQLLKS